MELKDEHTADRFVWSCQLCRLPGEDPAEALEETLRSADTDFWEDAEALAAYLRLTGLSQAECARSLGRSQSSVANRLRLLRLSPALRTRMRDRGLTERHARALLRLPEDERDAVLDTVLALELNVAETESLTEHRLKNGGVSPLPAAAGELLEYVDRLRQTDPGVQLTVRESESLIHLLICIPKNTK